MLCRVDSHCLEGSGRTGKMDLKIKWNQTLCLSVESWKREIGVTEGWEKEKMERIGSKMCMIFDALTCIGAGCE